MLIIDHLCKYPLTTQKKVDFELFKQAVDLIIKKEHLTKEGLINIINIKASMNFGVISDSMLAEFPDIKPIERPNPPPGGGDLVIGPPPGGGLRPLVKSRVHMDPDWLSGFVEGEGCFFVNIYKRKDSVLGEGVKLVFKLTQDNRNNEVLALVSSHLACGKIYSQSSKGRVLDFMVTGLEDILGKIIPFFLAHPLKGAKLNEFQDFVKVAKLMQNKAHLTKGGLEEIRSTPPIPPPLKGPKGGGGSSALPRIY